MTSGWASEGSAESSAEKNSIVPIPGSRDSGRVAQNIATAELTVTADELARIAEIIPEGGIGGRLG